MKICIEQNAKPQFKAQVSERFIKSMRGYINNGPNRLRNNYKLDKKIEQYHKFGYENYTIEMQQKSGSLGFEYRLYAVKNEDASGKKIPLTPKPYDAYRKVYYRFMNFRKQEFINIMKKYTGKG